MIKLISNMVIMCFINCFIITAIAERQSMLPPKINGEDVGGEASQSMVHLDKS